MKIELATIQDVPELQKLQHKAFGPQCIELGWEDAFGAEPTDKEVMEFIDKNWYRLQFSQAVDVTPTTENRKNPKRQLREAEKQRQFDLRQAKKREKHKGH